MIPDDIIFLREQILLQIWRLIQEKYQGETSEEIQQEFEKIERAVQTMKALHNAPVKKP